MQMMRIGSVPRSHSWSPQICLQPLPAQRFVPKQKRRWLTGLPPATATETAVLSSANVTAPAAPQLVAARGAAAALCRPRPRERGRPLPELVCPPPGALEPGGAAADPDHRRGRVVRAIKVRDQPPAPRGSPAPALQRGHRRHAGHTVSACLTPPRHRCAARPGRRQRMSPHKPTALALAPAPAPGPGAGPMAVAALQL